RVRPLLQARENVLELHHPRIGEHQGWVIARHQRGRWDHLVIIAREEIEETFSDIVDAAHFRTVRASFACARPFSEPVSCAPDGNVNSRPAYCFQGLFSGGGGVSLRCKTRNPWASLFSGCAKAKMLSPPSSVAAALRSRVPTGANA